jgi:hypothetical protein
VTLTRNAVTNGSFSGTNDASISFDIAFNEIIANSTFVLGDVSISNVSGVVLGTAVLTPDGDNQNYTLTIPITSGNGNIGISIASGDVTDAAGNGLGSTTTSLNITIDNTAPSFSLVSPANNTSVNNANLAYTLSEAIISGTVTFTRIGGVADGSSPHVIAITGVRLNSGSFSGALASPPSLVNGAIYSISFDGTDAAGNH